VASKGTPLGIGLGIDFAALDADLARVADKIEAVGAKASVKVGTFAGLASSGQIKGDQLQAQVSNIGVSLSQAPPARRSSGSRPGSTGCSTGSPGRPSRCSSGSTRR
jgi:hypothetical protein